MGRPETVDDAAEGTVRNNTPRHGDSAQNKLAKVGRSGNSGTWRSRQWHKVASMNRSGFEGMIRTGQGRPSDRRGKKWFTAAYVSADTRLVRLLCRDQTGH